MDDQSVNTKPVKARVVQVPVIWVHSQFDNVIYSWIFLLQMKTQLKGISANEILKLIIPSLERSVKVLQYYHR